MTKIERFQRQQKGNGHSPQPSQSSVPPVGKFSPLGPLPRLLFRAREAAQMLGIGLDSFRRLVRSGAVKPVLIPGAGTARPGRRYSVRDLMDAIEDLRTRTDGIPSRKATE